MYLYLYSSIILLFFWFFIYLKLIKNRKEILFVSIVSLVGAFLEPLFLYEYWTPKVLFDLNLKIGLDIESFIFSFACGGIAVGLYKFFLNSKYIIIKVNKNSCKYYINRLGIFLPVVLMVGLYYGFGIDFIYVVFLALSVQFIFVMLVRFDLIKVMIYGGISFLIFYTIFFKIVIILFPDFLVSWSLEKLSGIFIVGLPIEELVWAFLFGTFAAIFYKYIFYLEERFV
jgi:hypothetical protein